MVMTRCRPRAGRVSVEAMIEDLPPRPPRALEPPRGALWQQLIRDQHGLLDTDQLRLLEIGPGVITANLEAQRRRQVLPRGSYRHSRVAQRQICEQQGVIAAGGCGLISQPLHVEDL